MIDPIFLFNATPSDANKAENVTSDLFAALIEALSNIGNPPNEPAIPLESLKGSKESSTQEADVQNPAYFYAPITLFSPPVSLATEGDAIISETKSEEDTPSTTLEGITTNRYLPHRSLIENPLSNIDTSSHGETVGQSSSLLQGLTSNPIKDQNLNHAALKPVANSIADPAPSPLLKHSDNAPLIPFNDLSNPRFQTDFTQHVKQALPHHTLVPPTEQVIVHVTHAALEKVDKIDITLFPPDLGKVKIEMNIDDDKKVQAVFHVEKAQTMDMLFRDQKNIEQSLNNIGLKVEDGAMRFELSQQQDQSSRQNHGFEKEGELAPIVKTEDDSAITQAISSNQSLIDLAI